MEVTGPKESPYNLQPRRKSTHYKVTFLDLKVEVISCQCMENKNVKWEFGEKKEQYFCNN